MKFRCERDALVEALATANRAVGKSGSLPVLSGIRFELTGDALALTGSDLDLTITAQAEVKGSDDGIAVLPARLATDIVRVLESGAVDVEVVAEEARIRSGRSEFAVRTIPAAEYPRVAEPSGDAVELDAQLLAQSLRQVVAAASTDESRPILTGVLLAAEGGGLRLVATDSYRLAVRDLPGTSFLSEGQSVLVPSQALKELGRLLDKASHITLRLGEREAAFELDRTRLVTRLIEGDFPNYRPLIPEQQPNCLTLSRQALLDAVKRVRVVANEPSLPVRLTMNSEGLALSAQAQDVGTAFEQLDAKYEGEELTVAFNPEYLLSGIEVTGGDEISIETVNELKPALLKSAESPDYKYVLMPVRVS